MGEPKVVVVSGRAKALRPSDSGTHRVHAANLSAPAQDTRPGDAPRQVSTGQVRSVSRRVTRTEAAAAFDVAAGLCGVSDVEIAAALDEPRQRVADMRRGERPIAMEHLVLIARRLPQLFEAYAKILFGGGE